MDEIGDALAGIKGRWMTGAEAAPAAPPAWRAMLDGRGDAELRLLALVAQATRVGLAAEPPEAPVPMAPLPDLALPIMPEGARMRLRQVIANAGTGSGTPRRALALAAARGFCAHPMDWMPGKTDTAAPALYAPWIDWLNAEGERGAVDVLDAETWDAWYPAERRAALTAMRATDPAAARDLIAAKAGGVAAEERVRLVGVLATGLGEKDAEFLASLSTDRSGKVKALAANLLARLGRGDGDAEEVAELAAMLEVSGGILRRKTLAPATLKNDAQRGRRAELFARVPLVALARAMGLSPDEAVAIWDVARDARATGDFVEAVAAGGADAVQAPLARRLFEAGQGQLVTETLLARLDAGERAALLPQAMARDDLRFAATLEMAGDDLGRVPLGALTGSDAARRLMTMVRRDEEDWRMIDGLRGLGLLADREAAVALLSHLMEAGLIAADPRLDVLHLNIALERT